LPLTFNTSGPCIPGEHYMLPPERRLEPVQQLIEERKYFTLHAGRQTGKTTSLMWLERHLNASGRWRALWVDLETARDEPDPAAALTTILKNVDDALRLEHAELDRPDTKEIEAALGNPATALLDTDTEAEALDQVARYFDHAGLGEGWLLLFDLRKEVSWADKLFVREVEHAGKQIRIVGC
jgi:hypothetical protein